MAKRPRLTKTKATTRSTSGSGYEFEDLVAGDLLSRFIRDVPIDGIAVPGRELQFQTEAAGWFIDDILCIGEPHDGQQAKLAISCKSMVKVTASGLPRDFVDAAWRQWRTPGPFDRSRDRLALVTRGRNTRFDALWHDIKTWSRGDAGLAIARINASNAHRTVFNTVFEAAPSAMPATAEETVALIACLEVYPLDFQLTPSRDLTTAIMRCREALVSESNEIAEGLWQSLVATGAAGRLSGGAISLDLVLRDLGKTYLLKGIPSVQASWNRLIAYSDDRCAGIETTLRNGYRLPRTSEIGALVTAIAARPYCVVTGDSGAGKSALVKLALDEQLPDSRQIWLGPDLLAAALGESTRGALGLEQPLLDILDRGPSGSKILVLDAVERLPQTAIPRVKELADRIAERFANGDANIRIVFVAQAMNPCPGPAALAWADALQQVQLSGLKTREVAAALRATPSLRWIADDNRLLDLLGNLRVLGWVIESASSFPEGDADAFASITTVADRIWSRWTNDRTQLQRLMIRFAERDAAFERSFAISELDGSDAAAFDERPDDLPLVVNSRRRIEFQHDLASDWARYQRLKEIVDDVPRWAALAPQPLWISALRMLGQFLLMQTDQAAHGWDNAFRRVSENGDLAAADLLLDALCLDPALDLHLQSRLELFFANKGALLLRLLNRFIHVATVPSMPPSADIDPELRLYVDAEWRFPIINRWAPLGRFFAGNLERIGNLGASVVSKICRIWLQSTPLLWGDEPMPLRGVMARAALETARTEQITRVAHRLIGGHGEPGNTIYLAALAGAAELPEAVGEFALEMAHRRPLSPTSQQRVERLRAAEQAERDARQLGHPQRPGATPPPRFLSSRRDLPPWELGPTGRLMGSFRGAVLKNQALVPLMKASPDVAAEILLACIIEGNPTEEYGSSGLRENFGVEYDQESYPTFFTKSPFFAFLEYAPEVAFRTLRSLLGFAIERWASSAPPGTEVPAIMVELNGDVRAFPGNSYIFGWSQHNSTGAGQLFSALDALERWLALKAEAGEDLTPWCRRLLEAGNSTATLGVLVNLGKLQPALFKGVLRPLAGIEQLYWWDHHRVRNVNYNFVAWKWAPLGEPIFQLARSWTLAPHRKEELAAVISGIARDDADYATAIRAFTATWPKPSKPKEKLEQLALRARLDPANYRTGTDPETGDPVSGLVYPPDLQRQLAEFQRGAAMSLQTLTLPYQCDKALAQDGVLVDDDAEFLANLLPALDVPLPESEGERKLIAAAAATLIVKGGDWIAANIDAMARSERVVDALIDAIGETYESLRNRDFGSEGDILRYAAIGALHRAMEADDPAAWDRPLLKILTSREPTAVGALMLEASRHRRRLGPAWFRMMQLLILAAGLDHLSPHFQENEALAPLWEKWLTQLRAQRIFGIDAAMEDIRPAEVAARTERLANARGRRMGFLTDQVGNESRRFAGISSSTLNAGFAWLLDHEGAATIVQDAENRDLLGRLFAFEAWRLAGDDGAGFAGDDDEFDLPSELGYALLRIIPAAILAAPTGQMEPLWRSIFGLGPAGHVTVEHFVSSWFMELFSFPDADRFIAEWKKMIAVAWEADWRNSRLWYRGRRMLLQILGVDAPRELAASSAVSARLLELFPEIRRWATEIMPRSDDDVAAFAHFLTMPAGQIFRIDGMVWLNDAVNDNESLMRGTTGNQVAEAIDVVLNQHADSLFERADSREAMIALVARLVRGQVGTAMGLQARISTLR